MWAQASSDSDNFVLSYSTDNVNYIEMFTVQAEGAGILYQQYILPSGISGTVYIKLTDTDSTKGQLDLAAVYIDNMCFRVDMLAGVPPEAPVGLAAVSAFSISIELGWVDLSHNEVGFKIERSPDCGATWVEAGNVGADSEQYTDSGLSPDADFHHRVKSYYG